MKLNSTLTKALSSLTGDWQNLANLKRATGLPWVAFDDLRVAGLAQERRTPIMRSRIQCGEIIELCRA
jgi:hypothetical protein